MVERGGFQTAEVGLSRSWQKGTATDGGRVAVVTVVPRPAALYLDDRFLIAVIWRGLGATFTAQIDLGSQQEYLEGVVPHSNKALHDI